MCQQSLVTTHTLGPSTLPRSAVLHSQTALLKEMDDHWLLLQEVLAHAKVARALFGFPDKPAMVRVTAPIPTSQQMSHGTQGGPTHMHSPCRCEYHVAGACCYVTGSCVKTLTAILLAQDDHHWHDQLSQP